MNFHRKLLAGILSIFVLFQVSSCGSSSTFEFIALLCGGYATDANEFVAVGESGTSLYTNNGGSSYTLQDVPLKYDLTDYAVQNGLHYAVGLNSTLLTRLSLTSSYNIIDTGINADYYDIEFADNEVGYIAASNSLILKSANSGLNWSSLTVGDGNIKFSSIDCVDRNTCIAVGEVGMIYKTIDGFTSYTQLDAGVSVNFNSVMLTNSRNAWITGDSGYAGFSTDGGSTWSQIDTGTSNTINGISFNSDYSRAILYGDRYAAYSTDGGYQYQPSVFPEVDEEFVQDVMMFKLFLLFGSNPFRGVLLGDQGRAFFTSDGGSTFTSLTINVEDALSGEDGSGDGEDIDTSGSGEGSVTTPSPTATPDDEDSILEFTLSDQDFSFSHTVGQTSCPQKVGQFVVTNTGNTETNYTVSTSGNQLSTMPSSFSLSPGGTQTVMITFTCSQSSSFSGTITVEGTDQTSGVSTSVSAQVSGNVG